MIRQMIQILSNNAINVLEDLAGVSAIFVMLLVVLHLPVTTL